MYIKFLCQSNKSYIKASSLRFFIELPISRSGANPCARAISPYIKGIESLHQSAVTHQGVKVPDFYLMLGASIEICEIEGYVHVSKGYVHVSKSYVRVSKAICKIQLSH